MMLSILQADRLQEVGRFSDEDGDQYAAFVSGDSYAVGISDATGLEWVSIGGWVTPVGDVVAAARTTLACIDQDNQNYLKGMFV